MKDASDTLAALLPGMALQTTLGDQTVFEAVVAALGLPDGWQTRLVAAAIAGGASVTDAAEQAAEEQAEQIEEIKEEIERLQTQ